MICQFKLIFTSIACFITEKSDIEALDIRSDWISAFGINFIGSSFVTSTSACILNKFCVILVKNNGKRPSGASWISCTTSLSGFSDGDNSSFSSSFFLETFFILLLLLLLINNKI